MKKYVENCKHLNTCNNGINKDCVGCNVWNILYNYGDFVKWCKNQHLDIMRMDFEIRRNIKGV